MSSRSVALVVTVAMTLLATACAVTLTVEALLPQAASDENQATPTVAPVAGSAVVTGGPVQIAGRFEWTDASCEFSEPTEVASNCGWLEVPEHWDDPTDADTIRLHVGVFSAGPPSQQSPLSTSRAAPALMRSPISTSPLTCCSGAWSRPMTL